MQGPLTAGICGDGVNTEDAGVPTPNNPHQTLNFSGDVIVTDAGGGVANIVIGIGPSEEQRFSYTVTGVEPDLTELTIALPAVRPNALYLVWPSQGTAAHGLTMNVADASRTTVHFVLSLSGAATAGDTFHFLVNSPT